MACRTKPSRVDTGRRQASSMTSATQPDHSPPKSRSSPSLGGVCTTMTACLAFHGQSQQLRGLEEELRVCERGGGQVLGEERARFVEGRGRGGERGGTLAEPEGVEVVPAQGGVLVARQ